MWKHAVRRISFMRSHRLPRTNGPGISTTAARSANPPIKTITGVAILARATFA